MAEHLLNIFLGCKHGYPAYSLTVRQRSIFYISLVALNVSGNAQPYALAVVRNIEQSSREFLIHDHSLAGGMNLLAQYQGLLFIEV